MFDMDSLGRELTTGMHWPAFRFCLRLILLVNHSFKELLSVLCLEGLILFYWFFRGFP